MMRNPKWTRDELILALDLYHRIDPLRATPSHPEIRRLSRLLCSLPFHPKETRASTFRNPTGIVMTLRTLMRYDPESNHLGLRGSKMGQELWEEFNGRWSDLRDLAQAIITAGVSLKTEPAVPDDDEAIEGGILFRLHRLRERNRQLVTRKKAQVQLLRGRLGCEVCDFDFASTYGVLGGGFAECHHRLPLGRMSARGRVRLDDLALVCSNCHRMLHRQKTFVTVEHLRAVVSARRIEALDKKGGPKRGLVWSAGASD